MKKTHLLLPVGLLSFVTASFGATLSMMPASAANILQSNTASVTVNSTCSFDQDYDYTFNLSGTPGQSVNTTADATRGVANLTCNSPSGFIISARGFSPTASSAAGEDGATAMYGGASGSIATGTSGTDSYWGFKVSTLTASTGTVTSTYTGNNYFAVPSVLTTVASFSGSSSEVVTGTFRADYNVYVAPAQPAGTYTGAVKYIITAN